MATYTHDELIRQLRSIRAHRDSRYVVEHAERVELGMLLRAIANRILWSGRNV